MNRSVSLCIGFWHVSQHVCEHQLPPAPPDTAAVENPTIASCSPADATWHSRRVIFAS